MERLQPEGLTMRRAAILLPMLLIGCSSGKKPAAAAQDTVTLTQRQRDSVIGASKIPGAGGVTKAMRAQDTAKAQAAALDSIR